jgi:hypothetical protein
VSSNATPRDRIVANEIQDPFLRRTVKTGLHLRRYLPFYVFGTIWVVTLALFPSIRNDGGAKDTANAGVTSLGAGRSSGTSATDATETAAADTADTGAGTDLTSAGGTTATGGTAAGTSGAKKTTGAAGTTGGTVSGGVDTNAPPAADAVQRGTGVARAGFECKPGLPQIPNSSYALPCQNVYDGPNGGATFRGVTDKDIVVVHRKFPDSANQRAVDQVNQQAGFASRDVIEATRKVFIDYFNKTYELYGRQVKYSVYESPNGDSTNEAQSKGKEKACLDADQLVKDMKVFAVVAGDGGTQPFSECAAERQLPVTQASAYFPESYYRKYQPYMWNTVMECERISHQVAEYIGKRLLNQPAKWAGDPVLQKKTRYFGTYVPDNDGYQRCVNITHNDLKTKYGVTDTGEQYNYQLDVSRFPDQAAQAAVQFSAKGVTTVLLACDYISTTVLTAAAQRQNWHPEWLQIGTAANDTDNAARLFDQTQVNGHLFGPSQLGATTKIYGTDSEPGRIYKQATGKDIPAGTTGDYFGFVLAFNLFQAAGPILTPENMGKGAMTIPPGGAPDFPLGYWSLADGADGTPGVGDHTTIDDYREIYWVADPNVETASQKNASPDPYYNGPDGHNGTYKETYGGQRFRNGEWKTEPPPIYPPH